MTTVSILSTLLLANMVGVFQTLRAEGGEDTNQSVLFLDGRLEEPIWKPVPVIKLQPLESGVPLELGATALVSFIGNYLCSGVEIPEPEGKILAYSIGFNPTWEKNASTYFLGLDRLLSPSEDRFVVRMEFSTHGRAPSNLQLEINPWGALRIERDHALLSDTSIRAATSISREGWWIEAAVPLEEFDLDPSDPTVTLSLEQIRSRRPLAPEFRWRSPQPVQFDLRSLDKEDPQIEVRSTDSVATDLTVGYIQALPPLDGNWDDPFWSRVPALELSRNEPCPRRPQYPTEIKWVHDGKTLSLFFRCQEDTRVVCNIQRRDDRVETDDHVCIYLAITGSSLVEILVNPTGAVLDQEGIRSNNYFNGIGEWRKKGYAHTNWDADIKTHPLITKDYWYARVDVPLDQVARALGSSQLPRRWKILLGRVRQRRIGEPREVSSLPVIESPSFRAPARYSEVELSNLSPVSLAKIEPEFARQELPGLAGELVGLDSFVLSRLERRYRDVPGMLSRSVSRRVTGLAMEEHREWATIETKEDWERYRDRRSGFLRASFGDFPKNRTALDVQVTGTFRGEGYLVQNIVYQSRPGVFVPANLYLPLKLERQVPAIIINPGHGMPKTQEVNKDCGMIWARTGCAVLVPEKVGHGERIETLPWDMQAYYSEELHDMQLGLIGQSRQGWIAWDISRAVDLLLELGYVDRERIILMGGATWGGGPTAAVAGFLENRLAATVIFNFGRVYWLTGGGWRLRDCTTQKIPDWFFCASVAPRKFIYAHEFWYEGEEGPDYPSVWEPAWPRYEKIYALYGALENLANAQSDGLLRLDTGHCASIDHLARREIYPLLNKWFGIPFPAAEDWSIEIDSQYGTDRLDYPLIKYKEEQRRMPDHKLICITPEVSAQLERKALHQIAWQRGKELLETARRSRASQALNSRRQDFRDNLSKALGEISPPANLEVEKIWSRGLSDAVAEALLVHTETGVFVPFLLLKPATQKTVHAPAVIALAEGGKDRFLKNRSQDVAALLQAGVVVCLPDLRGTGETAPDQYKTQSHAQLYEELPLGNTLLGLRLKDVRTLLAYLRSRDDVDPKRIALWGDSFSPPNQQEIWVDELIRTPVSPQIQHYASPMGPHLALLAALYEPTTAAVALRGGLASYLSLLETAIVYIPLDISIPDILKTADIPDICAALAPMPLLAEQFVSGRNFLLRPADLDGLMEIAREMYRQQDATRNLVLRSTGQEPSLTSWLIEQLKL